MSNRSHYLIYNYTQERDAQLIGNIGADNQATIGEHCGNPAVPESHQSVVGSHSIAGNLLLGVARWSDRWWCWQSHIQCSASVSVKHAGNDRNIYKI